MGASFISCAFVYLYDFYITLPFNKRLHSHMIAFNNFSYSFQWH